MVDIAILIVDQKGTAAVGRMQCMDHKRLPLLVGQCGVRMCWQKGDIRQRECAVLFGSLECAFDLIGKEPVHSWVFAEQGKDFRVVVIRMAVAAENKQFL